LDKQGKLLEETKAVVSQQATAISSQATVVDAAIKYSQNFSTERIEHIVRREVELEYKDERNELESKIQDLSKKKEGPAEGLLQFAVQTAIEKTASVFEPIVLRYSLFLLSLPADARSKELSSIDNHEARTLMGSIAEKADKLPRDGSAT